MITIFGAWWRVANYFFRKKKKRNAEEKVAVVREKYIPGGIVDSLRFRHVILEVETDRVSRPINSNP